MAVLKSDLVEVAVYAQRRKADFSIEWFNGTVGAGGQHRNKTANSIWLCHRPTGLTQTAQTRSRENSFSLAMAQMHRNLDAEMAAAAAGQVNAVRRRRLVLVCDRRSGAGR